MGKIVEFKHTEQEVEKGIFLFICIDPPTVKQYENFSIEYEEKFQAWVVHIRANDINRVIELEHKAIEILESANKKEIPPTANQSI